MISLCIAIYFFQKNRVINFLISAAFSSFYLTIIVNFLCILAQKQTAVGDIVDIVRDFVIGIISIAIGANVGILFIKERSNNIKNP